MSNRLALGVDVGGTKIAIALVDGKLGVSERIDVPSFATDGFELWGRIADAATEILSKANGEVVGIGIGSAGPIYPIPGTVSPVNIPVWRDFPLVKCFQDVFQIDRVTLHGDAMALAHAEHKIGAGVGSRNMLGIVVSTGIGGGLIIDNELFDGETGNTSYFGHSSIDFQERNAPAVELAVLRHMPAVQIWLHLPRNWAGEVQVIHSSMLRRRPVLVMLLRCRQLKLVRKH